MKKKEYIMTHNSTGWTGLEGDQAKFTIRGAMPIIVSFILAVAATIFIL